MKRKIIGIFILLILICVAFYLYKRYTPVEKRGLKDIAFNDNLLDCVDKLYFEHNIPIVLEGFEYTLPPNAPPRISYSAKKTTVRQLLDSIVSQKSFSWTTDGNFIHIISTALASRPDYPMNSVIEHISAKNVDRNVLIKLALAQIEKNNVSEPLIFVEYPYAKYDIIFDPPKISIDIKHATLREVLDQISRKGGINYEVQREKNHDPAYALRAPLGSYVLWLMVKEDFVPRFGSRVQIQKH